MFNASADDVSRFASRRTAAADLRKVRIEQIGLQSAQAEIDLVFDDVRARVPPFGAWAYGWTSNYIFSYELLFAAIKGAWTRLTDGDAVLPGLEDSIDRAITAQFKRRVFEAADYGRKLATARDAASDDLTAEWRRFLAAETSAWMSFAATATCEGTLAPARARMVVDLSERTARSSAEVVEPLELREADAFKLRALRPLGARVAILVLRVFEVGSLAMLPAALGLAGSPALILGSVLTVGIVWGIDYLINSVDAALHRQTFEAAVYERIGVLKKSTDDAMQNIIKADLVLLSTKYIEGLHALTKIDAPALNETKERTR